MSEISSTLLSTALTELPAAITAASHSFAISAIARVAFGRVSWDIFEFGDFLW